MTFTIVIDHRSLIWLFNVNDPGLILMRWRLKLEEYDYKIIHKAGNTNADALSRNPIRNDACTTFSQKREKTTTKKTRKVSQRNIRKKRNSKYYMKLAGRH